MNDTSVIRPTRCVWASFDDGVDEPARLDNYLTWPIDQELADLASPEAIFLNYIAQEYDQLADITVFLHNRAAQLGVTRQSGLPSTVPGYLPLSQSRLIEALDRSAQQLYLELFQDPEHQVTGHAPQFVSCSAGSLFAACKETIRARPRAFYQRAAELLTQHPQAAHVVERSWHRMFHTPTGTRGLVTAADRHIFRDLQYLVLSLRAVSDCPLMIYDLGLLPHQLRWCLEQKHVICRASLAYHPSLASYVGSHRWQAWLKPAYIEQAPWDDVLWIDADCVVLRDPEELFAELDSGPLLMPEVAPGCGRNHRELYRFHLPLDDRDAIHSTEINNGVIGFRRPRDRELLDAWLYAVKWAVENPECQHLIRWYDQGALLWAVLRTHNECHIRTSQVWNWPANPYAFSLADAIRDHSSILSAIAAAHPQAGIVHWFGICKLSVAIDLAIQRLFIEPEPSTLVGPQVG